LTDRPEARTKVYVRLLDEGVDVWRPVDAIELSDGPTLVAVADR